MAARCGWSPAAAVVVYLLCDVIGVSLGRHCKKNGCCYNDERTQLTCSLTDPNVPIDLRGGPMLEDVKIMHGDTVSLDNNAVSTNSRLRSLLFSDIQYLTLKGNTDVQVGSNRDVSLTVRRVGSLRIQRSAFDGWQSQLATLSITDTDSVHIDPIAFRASSRFRRVQLFNITTLTLETDAIYGIIGQLELENVRSLLLHPGAIRAAVQDLNIRHVNGGTCPPQAISGNMGVVTIRSVTFSNVESRCLDADRHWSSLTLTDSQLGHLSAHSVYGTIDNISISDCRIGSTGPMAVSVRVTELRMSDVSVGRLSPRSLQVEAIDSVTLRGVSVAHLRQDALRGLQVTGTSSGVTVSGLTARRADPGSLRFADGAQVTLTDLRLTGGCVCSTPDWARQLLLGPTGDEEHGLRSGDESGSVSGEEGSSGDGEDGTYGGGDGRLPGGGLSEDREALLRQIQSGFCTVDKSATLADFTARHCGNSTRAGSLGGDPAESASPLADWWSYLGVVLLSVLLLVLAVLLVMAAVRCHRRRRLKQRLHSPEPLEMTGAEGDGPAAGPAAEGKQRGDSRNCRLSPPSENASPEPEAVYTDVIYRVPDDGHKGPPVGGSKRESPSYSRLARRSRSPTGPYAVSDQTNGSSCKTTPLSGSEPVYANMPGGETGAEASPGAGDVRQSPGQSTTQAVTKGTGAKQGDQTDNAAAGRAEDLPDYAEITLDSPANRRSNSADCMVANQLYGSAG